METTAASTLLLQDLTSVHNIQPVTNHSDLVMKTSDPPIPLIDLQGLTGPYRPQLVREIGLACMSDGFFQVKNHGIPSSLITDMLKVAREFFMLPESERMKIYSNDPINPSNISRNSIVNLNVGDAGIWRNFLRINCYPVEDVVHEWPSNPSNFRPVVSEYCKCTTELASKLIEAISESLGLEGDYIEKAQGKKAQRMAINYYPPCHKEELTCGITSHKDPYVITILLQDDVSGLEVLRGGKWVAVHPIPDTFVINVGEQVEVISNGRYKSVLHRAILNRERERFSIPIFYSPALDAVIGPAESLVDEEHPAVYRKFTYQEYSDHYVNRWIDILDNFKIGN